MKKVFIIALILVSNIAFSGQTPKRLSIDPRSKMLVYQPHQIYQVRTAYGHGTTIHFADYETVLTALVFDSAGFAVFKPADNVISIRPQAENASSNLEVITDKRNYTFELTSFWPQSTKDRSLTLKISFVYPEDEQREMERQLARQRSTIRSSAAHPGAWNVQYEFSGDELIAPEFVQDNGERTYFRFNPKLGMPAIYKVNPDLTESIANWHIDPEYPEWIFVNTVWKQWTIRRGSYVACVFNNNFSAVNRTENMIKKSKTF